MLALAGRLHWLAVVVTVGRDAALVFGSPLAVKRGYQISVSRLGKLATWLIFVGLLALLLTEPGTTWPAVLFWVGVAIAVVAALRYLGPARWALLGKPASSRETSS